MIRGSIEVVERDRVAGWIYCSAAPVQDKLILAFVGNRCVGAGKVERFRQDLLDAQLDNGFCGYDFAIDLLPGENLGAVVVKLQNADAALIQSESRLVGPQDDARLHTTDLGAVAPASVSWMQDRGWLEQHEYDFLKAVQGIGAYERGLRPPRRSPGEAPVLIKPEIMAQDLLGLYMLSEVDVTASHVAGLSDLGGEASPLRDSPVSVVALWSSERVRLCLDERSHLLPATSQGHVLSEAPGGGIDYSFGPDRMLFLHRDCAFAPQGAAPAGGITIFTATPRAARKSGAETAIRRVKAVA